MLRRLLPALLTALVAVAGFEVTPAATASLVLAVALTAAVSIAAMRMLARTSAQTRPVRVGTARDAWLDAVVTLSPTHTDARAMMRPRPPSVAL
ncbi:hypothetical protein [Humibacter ginsenosidimutans]|uniref:Uncharacterized protein n=1 Tax=Humibacter ginsenosidimutans TaxID=2599293 RepID=A0A5B8M3Q7_9MICO|nr:hypothetical protein [Humibacter ginsenosidimutans]QDZ14574.1 hypothetical protein FPZ11_07230 [Humibacter ginsenosidimutans]